MGGVRKLTESGALWYDAGAPRGALGAVTYGGWLISLRFDSKGGDADVERTGVLGTPVSGVFGLCGLHTDHKRALTARLVPERST